MASDKMSRGARSRVFQLGSRLKHQILKRAIPPRTYTYLHPLDMTELDRQALLSGGCTGIWYEDGKAPRLLNRKRPSFLDDPDRVNLFSDSEIQDTPITYPPGLTLSGCDVTLIGYREFLTKEFRFFTDDALPGTERAQWLDRINSPHAQHTEETCFRRKNYRDTFSVRRSFLMAERMRERTVALVHQEPLNYGSWLFRVMAKLSNLRRLDLEDADVLVCMPYPSFKDLLVLGGLNEDRLIHHDFKRIYQFDHVIIPGNRNPYAFLDNESKAVFAELRDKVGYKRAGRKIYVARNQFGQVNKWNGRVMLNEAELIQRLEPLGFEVVVPAALTVHEQIRTFASASFVLGGSGSAMFNAVFCLPGTKLIDIESEPHWIHAHMCLFSSLGLEYGVFVGAVDPTDSADVHRRWRVNVPALIERVRSWI